MGMGKGIANWFVYSKEILTLLMAGIAMCLLYKRVKIADKLVETNNRISYETSFSNAIKLFESENVDARMGALDSLQRISNEFPKYRDQVLQVCFRFIRNNSNIDIQPPGYTREDIKKVLEIFRERPIISKKSFFNPYSLNSSYLAWADFKEMEFENVDFIGACLKNADFRRASFERCDFSKSDLSYTHFCGTKLFGANFIDSDLSFVDFNYTDLREAYFARSILIGTKLLDIEKEKFPIKQFDNMKDFIFFEKCMIVHEGQLLANDEKFHQSEYGNPSKFEEAKKELAEGIATADPPIEYSHFDTKFPEFIDVKPQEDGISFKLEWVDKSHPQTGKGG
jgi:pentapeptide repeat protein